MVNTKVPESELKSKQGGYFLGLVLTFVLVPMKADPTIRKQNCKQGMVYAQNAGHIDMILAFFHTVLGGL